MLLSLLPTPAATSPLPLLTSDNPGPRSH